MPVPSPVLATAIVAAAPDPLLVVGLDGRLHAASPAAVRQLAALGLAPADLAVDVRSFREFLRRCARTSSPLPGAVPFRRGDADARQFRCHGTRLVLPASREAAVLLRIAADALTDGGSVFRQLTHQVAKLHRELRERQELARRQREAEARLFETQKLDSLGLLAGGIAHDFNNLLMGVLGHIDLAGRDVPADGPAAESLRQAARSATRAADLTRQLLAYAGRGRFVVESIDLSALVADMVPLLEVAHAKKAVLRTMLDPAPPPLQGDATQLRQVLLNLVVNAAEAIGDATGTVTVSTGTLVLPTDDAETFAPGFALEPGAYVTLEVRDTGSGMDDAMRARIFDPFFTTKPDGHGLGLAAVLGIVRAHRGGLRVQSAPGRGTVFQLCFPAAERPLRAVPMPPARPAAFDADRPLRELLVADDDATVRSVLARALARLPLQVTFCEDGTDALRTFRARPDAFAVVLLDMMMPGLNGDEVFRAIADARPATPVVLMSGYAEQEVVGRLPGRTLAGYLHKPFQLDDLFHLLDRLLQPAAAQ